MALIDKASLLMVPSTYEAGKLYNVLPSGNRAPDNKGGAGYDQTRADFDFDRGSNTAATRIDSNGVLQKYRENELLQSNQFDTTWANSNTTETGGQEDKDGGTDAWLLTKSAVASGYIAQTKSTSGVSTASVYVKAGTIDTITLWCNQVGGGNPFGTFNLATQTLTDSGTIVDSNITSVGIDWYRVSITFSVNTTLFRIYVNNFSDTTAGSIYIQSAQLESGLVSTDYLNSTSVTGKAGVLVDLPRINYDANGENGSLLLEPSRQNKIQFSEYYGDSSWNNSNEVTRSISSIVSPEGFLNAYDIIPTTANTNHTLRAPNLSGFTSGAVVNVSFFAKEKGYKFISVVGGFGSSNTPAVVFNLEAGTIESGTGTIEDYGNGWYRCISPITLNATALYCVGTILNDSQSGSFSGDATKGISVFGYQIEEASYPSSYIPNHGESGGVTRAADSCSVTGASDVIGQTEGTLFMDVDLYARDSFSYFALAPNLGSTSVYIGIGITATNFSFEVLNSGVQVAYNYSNSSTGNFKLAFAYKANDFVAYVNGTQVMTDTSGNVPACSQIALNQYDKDQPLLYKQATLFKERLTNAELATLTTL
jgi:hypothetical protein